MRIFFKKDRLTSTDVGDDKIPYLEAPIVVRAQSRDPAMESSRKRCTRVFEARLCHCMEALSIFDNGDQYDHPSREEEDAHAPKNSKVTEVFTSTEMASGE